MKTMYTLNQAYSYTSSSTFQDLVPALPWRNIPKLIRVSKHSTTHASLSPPQHSNIKSVTEVQPRSAAKLTPLTPINFLERAAVVYGGCTSIIFNDITWTWSETHLRCLKLASSIVSLGIERGDVVSVVAPNVPAMCELHFAIPMAAAVINTINLRLDAAAVSNLLLHSESKLVFVDFQFAARVFDAVSMLPPHHPRPDLVLIGGAGDDCEDRLTYSFNHGDFDFDYEKMVESGDAAFEWRRPEYEDDKIALNYTSGTTAAPKGVVLSHRSTFLTALNCLLEWSVPKQPVYLWTVPMFHCNGWSFAWGMAAVGGVNVCLRRLEAAAVYGALEKYKVTHLGAAPVVLNMLANYPGRKALKTPVNVMSGGAPPHAAVLGRIESLGFIVTQIYGLTETLGMVVTCAWKQEWDHLPASERAKMKARQGVGTICSPEVDVVDVYSGESVPRDGSTMGEVVLRGSTVMLGYLKDPEATWRCINKDGWLFTGDVGVMHADGYLEVKDRSKDVIICGGENISSLDVEGVLYAHPAVHEAAVVARPDGYWGQTPCAFVTLKEEAAEKPSEKEVREFCKENLPLFMVPRTVVFVAELPKTATGKVQKFLLRDMAKNLGKI